MNNRVRMLAVTWVVPDESCKTQYTGVGWAIRDIDDENGFQLVTWEQGTPLYIPKQCVINVEVLMVVETSDQLIAASNNPPPCKEVLP